MIRNLIPRLQVVVARDQARADRVLAGLEVGQEVFLTRLTPDLFKVSDGVSPNESRILGVIPAEWSHRIAVATESGRQCRIWYVGTLPQIKSPDGSFRMLLTVWCSTRHGTKWREIGADELIRTARIQDEPMPRPTQTQSPLFLSRIHDPVHGHMRSAIDDVRRCTTRQSGSASHALTDSVVLGGSFGHLRKRPAYPDQAHPLGDTAPSVAAEQIPLDRTSLSTQQLDRIKEAVRRKLAQNAPPEDAS